MEVKSEKLNTLYERQYILNLPCLLVPIFYNIKDKKFNDERKNKKQ
ncbi:hypothetical protein ACTAZI_10305 [Legionella bozemanae]